jgi:hypothetical protein
MTYDDNDDGLCEKSSINGWDFKFFCCGSDQELKE